MRKIAEGYTREILGPQLNALGVKDSQTCLVTTDVHLRLNALLSYHPGHPTLQTLLATAKEEASFYLPQEAPLEIRALTVLAVRNSLLEDLHTHRPYILMPGRKPLTDQQMEEITISAIKYISHEMPNATPNDTPPQDHLFRHFPMQYPFA